MEIFKEMAKEGHEQLFLCQHKKSGLKGIIAIHNTVLGPGLGGCRMWNYEDEDEAIYDALRLAKGMTYKSAAAGVDFGGAKAVIYADPRKDKSERLFRAMGRFIEGLKGRFSTGTDVGTVFEDFVIMGRETDYVGALPEEYGGSGDTSVITAYGTWKGLKACAKEKYGTDSLEGLKIVVQGVGKVGHKLVGHLTEEGAEIVVCDVNQEYLERVKRDYPAVEVVDPDKAYDVECHIFSPNALGSVVNDETIDRFNCEIIGGAANNVLEDEEKHGKALEGKGILYAPDYVINSGGLIQVADETAEEEYSKERAFKKADDIYDMLLEVFRLARENRIPTLKAADMMAENRIEGVYQIRRIFPGK